MLHELVSQRSMKFFSRFNINVDFLKTDPELWATNDDYKNAKHYLSHLKVVNDCAERGVALMKEFNSSITKNEEQKQYLLKVVQKHRKRFPNVNKSTLEVP